MKRFVFAAALCAAATAHAEAPRTEAPSPARVRLLSAAGGSATRAVAATVAAGKHATIATRVAATVSKIYVEEGDHVTQGQILDDYAPLVKPGGRLVYATCSLLARENARVVDAFLARTPGFARTSACAVLARQGVDVHAFDGDDLTLDPLRNGTDGFYAAALVRAP